jgi:hypothetical protein
MLLMPNRVLTGAANVVLFGVMLAVNLTGVKPFFNCSSRCISASRFDKMLAMDLRRCVAGDSGRGTFELAAELLDMAVLMTGNEGADCGEEGTDLLSDDDVSQLKSEDFLFCFCLYFCKWLATCSRVSPSTFM